MAEVNSFNKAEQVANRKMKPSYHGIVKCATIRMPVTYAQLAIDDTVATGVILPAGARLLAPFVRNGAGTASSTLNIGLRKKSDATVVDATALASLLAITSAAAASVATGTKIAAGVEYTLAEDCEVYLTAKGAVLAANQLLEINVLYVAP
jgi:hypothetical protein